MTSVMCLIDDKYIPLYRILWISDVPHFCGDDDCVCEGRYEIRLEMDESIWASREERDQAVEELKAWATGGEPDNGWR